MKKLIMVMFSLCMLIAVSGCQTSNDELSPNEFTEQFVNDFFSFKYDENLNETESYSHLIEELKPYFTEDGYTTFTKNNYGFLPIEASEKYKSDITVNDIQLKELFNDGTEVGYNIDVELQLPSDVATVNLNLSICKEDSNWKVYAIEVSTIDEF
ncbi:MAG: hypothetical protein ACLR0A_15045 [Faecalibacillus intestinalis]